MERVVVSHLPWGRLVSYHRSYVSKDWLFDDFVGQGGTLANLRGYLEAMGGHVAGATALTGRPDSATLGLTAPTLAALRRKHGNLEQWWAAELGYGFDRLTESEARYLLRAEDARTIRDRLAAAR